MLLPCTRNAMELTLLYTMRACPADQRKPINSMPARHVKRVDDAAPAARACSGASYWWSPIFRRSIRSLTFGPPPFSSMNSTPANLSPLSLERQFDLGCTQYDINMDCIIRENDQAIVPVQDTTVKQRMYIAVDGFNIAMNSACDFPNSQWSCSSDGADQRPALGCHQPK